MPSLSCVQVCHEPLREPARAGAPWIPTSFCVGLGLRAALGRGCPPCFEAFSCPWTPPVTFDTLLAMAWAQYTIRRDTLMSQV